MIILRSIKKSYLRGAETVWALKGIDLEVQKGDFIAITGESGSGKTTLLHIAGMLDKPTSGTVLVDDKEIHSLTDKELTIFRREKVGFVFQHFYLIPGLTVEENIRLPLMFSGKKVAKSKVDGLIEVVGLETQKHHTTSQLSGGQMQRVAIARALVCNPDVILADEPTGNLDSQNSQKIMQIFEHLNKQGIAVVMITHNAELAQIAKKQIRLKDGLVEN